MGVGAVAKHRAEYVLQYATAAALRIGQQGDGHAAAHPGEQDTFAEGWFPVSDTRERIAAQLATRPQPRRGHETQNRESFLHVLGQTPQAGNDSEMTDRIVRAQLRNLTRHRCRTVLGADNVVPRVAEQLQPTVET